MNNLFSKFRTLRRRSKKHDLCPTEGRNVGAFHGENQVVARSYRATACWKICNQATQLDSKCKGNTSTLTAETVQKFQDQRNGSFQQKSNRFCNPADILTETTKEFTSEVHRRIDFVLNSLYAEEFICDMLLVEFMMSLFASRKELVMQENDERNENQEGELELQEWIIIMTEKINQKKRKEKHFVPKTRIPGPVGRPVIASFSSQ